MSQEQAGPGHRYFLVVRDKDISMTGALPGATPPNGCGLRLARCFCAFLETEEAVFKAGRIIGTELFFFRLVWVWMLLVVILNNMKSALVDIEVDVPLFKIRSTSLPNFRFRVKSFYLRPNGLTYTLALNTMLHIQEIQMVVSGFLIYLHDGTTHHTAIFHRSISHTPGLRQGCIDVAFRENHFRNGAVFSLRSFLKCLLHVSLECREGLLR